MILAQNHVTRLSRYKRVLLRLKKAGLQNVFARNLADASGLRPAQVRKDFSILEIHGQKKGGYEVDKLLTQLEKLLGLDQRRDAILVGCGRVGSSIIDFPEFQSEQIQITAAFDIDPEKYSDEENVPVYSMDELENYIKNNPINIAIIAVPITVAQQVTDQLIELGIIGVLNLTSRYVRTPDDVYVNHIDLTMALESVIFNTPIIRKENPNEEN